ncbi:MAG: hypothetical protein IT346_02445 [Epsilonproteobacteria bacterium]|nr:hypothetical protein [Campylobacterota bacterium]
MKFLSRKALLVILSLGMPLAQASDTDSSPSKFKAVLGFVATATLLIAGKKVYNSFFRPANLEAVKEVHCKETAENQAHLDSVITPFNRAKEEASELLNLAERTRDGAYDTHKQKNTTLSWNKYYCAQDDYTKAKKHRDSVFGAQDAAITDAELRLAAHQLNIDKKRNDGLRRLKMQKESWFSLTMQTKDNEVIWFPRVRAFLSRR